MARVTRDVTEVVETAPWPCLKLGMEFEGCWGNDLVPGSRDRYAREVSGSREFVMHGDGSVQTASGGNWVYRGEWVTQPLTSWDGVLGAIDRGYPDGIDDSCGFHIHTSWTVDAYSRLADKAFWEHFRAFWARVLNDPPTSFNNEDKRRLRLRYDGNNNHFCRVEFTPWEQMKRNGDRYTQLNYCWSKHKTIECRMLPKFESLSAAKDAVRLLLECYHTFLSADTGEQEIAVSEPTVDLSVPITGTVEELVAVHVEERLVVRDVVDVVETAETMRVDMDDTVDTTALSDSVDIHQDYLKRAPAGSFKMLELGSQEPRAVRDRVRAYLKKLGAEEPEDIDHAE